MKFYLFDKYLGATNLIPFPAKEVEGMLQSKYFDSNRRYFVPENQCFRTGVKVIDSLYPIPAINTIEIYKELLEKGLITND